MGLYPLLDLFRTKILSKQEEEAAEGLPTSAAVTNGLSSSADQERALLKESCRKLATKLASDISCIKTGTYPDELSSISKWAKDRITEIIKVNTIPLPTNSKLFKEITNILDSIFRLELVEQDSTDYLNSTAINPNLRTIVETLVVEDISEIVFQNNETDEPEFPKYVDWSPDKDDFAVDANDALSEASPTDFDSDEQPSPDDLIKDSIYDESFASLQGIAKSSVPYLFAMLKEDIDHLRNSGWIDALGDDFKPGDFDPDRLELILETLEEFNLGKDPEQIQFMSTYLQEEYEKLTGSNKKLPAEDSGEHNLLERIVSVLSSFDKLPFDQQTLDILRNCLGRYSSPEIRIPCLKALSKLPENRLQIDEDLFRSLSHDLRSEDDALSSYAASVLCSAAPHSFTPEDIISLSKALEMSKKPNLIATVLIQIGKKNPDFINEILAKQIEILISRNSKDKTLSHYNALIISELAANTNPIDDFRQTIHNQQQTLSEPNQKILIATENRIKQKLRQEIDLGNPHSLSRTYCGDLDRLEQIIQQHKFKAAKYLLLHSYNPALIDRMKSLALSDSIDQDTQARAIDLLVFVASNKDQILKAGLTDEKDVLGLDDDDACETEDLEPMFSQADQTAFKLLLGDAPPEIQTQALDALTDIARTSTKDETINHATTSFLYLQSTGEDRLRILINEDPNLERRVSQMAELLLR